MNGTEGYNQLAREIARRIRDQTKKPETVELGIIKDDGSLLCDKFQIPIPAGDYLKSEGLVLENGDRVLVVWINGYRDAVVVNRIVSS